MNAVEPSKEKTFYTDDHEWVNFQDTVAYTGVCSFKLLGYKEIDDISFTKAIGFKKKGEIIATINYDDYHIEAHMPVDGQIIELNRELMCDDKMVLLRSPENEGWIALIIPTVPSQRMELLPSKAYELRNKNKFM